MPNLGCAVPWLFVCLKLGFASVPCRCVLASVSTVPTDCFQLPGRTVAPPSSPDLQVEKLKAHETNIMKLLQKGEEEGAMSMQMLEGNVVEKPAATEGTSESGDASTEEVEVRARRDGMHRCALSSAVSAQA